MAINDCPETASKTYLEKNLEYGHFKVKKFQKKFSRFSMHSSTQFPNGKNFH